jgi:hypothetical protein
MNPGTAPAMAAQASGSRAPAVKFLCDDRCPVHGTDRGFFGRGQVLGYLTRESQEKKKRADGIARKP